MFRFPVAVYLFVVFLSGIVVGALAHNVYTASAVHAERRPRNADEYRRKYVEEMTARLKLTTIQVRQLNGILDETRLRYREVRERVLPDFKAIHQKQVEQIRAVLAPGQRAEYEKLREEREQLQHKRQHR